MLNVQSVPAQADRAEGLPAPAVESAVAEVVAAIRAFAEERPTLVRTSFLTGSYLTGHWNRSRPNLNVYFIAQAGRADDLRLAAGDLWREIRAGLAVQGRTLLVDCHPFTLSRKPLQDADGLPVTVTSKVLEVEHRSRRYRLPPTIGPGWAANFRVLTGEAADLDCLRAHPRRNEEWIATVHSALSHYRNILDHLPWAVDRLHEPAVLVEEAHRYAEEAVKDALALGLTDEELSAGRHIVLLSDWATTALPFVAERFGVEGTAATAVVAELKAQSAVSNRAGSSEAEAAWRKAQDVMAWAWRVYLPVARELCPDRPELLRVDAFV